MVRLCLVIYILVVCNNTYAQNLNDNCENATDITSEIFTHSNFPDLCNSINGTAHDSYGSIDDIVDHPTIDAPIYSSQECIGYTSETTDEFPDIWYKSTLQSGYRHYQSIFFWGGDTIQAAVYYGQCGALFQSQCFTLTTQDTAYWAGAWIDYYPHHADDDLYIQIKVPPHYNDYFGMCFSYLEFGTLNYNFAYDRPAGTGGVNYLQPVFQRYPINIYPNPSGNWINMKADDQILSYLITDTQGRVRMKGKSNSSQAAVNISDLPSGMYIATVQTEYGMGITKFIRE